MQTGSTAGDTGPTRILLKGENKRPQFTNKFLDKHGVVTGSTIVMTPNAYITDKDWVLVSKSVVKGYRLIPFVCDNPQWMMLELIGSLGSHKRVLESHEIHTKFLVLSSKEESNTSHANQGCDKFVAKEYKRKSAETLYTQLMITPFLNNKGGRLDN